MMLRDENAELRRQLNYPRPGGGGGSGPNAGGGGYDQYPGTGPGNGGGGHGHMPPPQQAGDDKFTPLESPRLDRVSEAAPSRVAACLMKGQLC